MIRTESVMEIPEEVLADPALLFLYHRIEQILGIKAAGEALIKLNEYLEKCSGGTFIEKPAAYEYLLTSREQIFQISKTVTINETYFFREGAHFNLLSNFLPQLAKLNRPLQVCSAATSTGCEAYSIAMLLDHYAKNNPDFDYEIDAFDINAEVIETAKNGRYTTNTLRSDGAEWRHILDSYLVPSGDEYVVAENIRGKVHFFLHNIMRGLNKQYDIIFFRNALIYFSSKNRIIVLNDLAESLFHNGLLFLGVSETFTVKHPLLTGKHLSDVFYFQKTNNPVNPEHTEWEMNIMPPEKKRQNTEKKKPENQSAGKAKPASAKPASEKGGPEKPAQPKPFPSKQLELPVNFREVMVILGNEEGQPNAKKTLETLINEKNGSTNPESISGAELAASAVYFLNAQDFNSADSVLLHFEKSNNGAPVLFLRGEYHLLKGNTKEAELNFEHAAGKDRAFWPALYRIASLAAEGNRTRYEYKIKKACESLELGKELHYECFMGGFSPDYFKRILTQKAGALKIHEHELN